MTYDEAVELVTRLICRLRNLEPSRVPEDADLVHAVGLDSLDAAEILASLHKATGKELEIDSAEELRTVAGIARRLVAEMADL